MSKLFLSFLIIVGFALSAAQTHSSDTIFIAFWNFENLFDTADDPGKDDEEFTPSGDKGWNRDKLENKLYKLARGIRSMNNQNGPDILGVCEVEHNSLLESMMKNFLHEFNYKTAYAESPDTRGIDNGLIYNADKFSLLSQSSDRIDLPGGDQTRLILNVSLKSKNGDTLIFFVNHWPSRRTGEIESGEKRITAAGVLKKKIDFYLNKNSNSKLILLGDFNDEPDDISISGILKANPLSCGAESNKNLKELYNLAYAEFKKGEGSLKHKNDWNMLDQIIISGSILNESGPDFLCRSFEVYKPRFLQTYSGRHKGTPFPTYRGRKYLGGTSDHYPVTARIVLRKDKND